MEIIKKNVIIRNAIILAVLVLLASTFYTFYSMTEEKAFTGSGKIDIGGYSLFIKSEGNGKPTVVFDSGYGMTYTQWYSVLKELDNKTRTVIYSRAGIGGSEKSPLDRTCATKAEELHKLLTEANIKPPYILVGHSMGGFDVRMYAAKYPKEVAGIILVDASQEDIRDRRLEKMTEEEKKSFLESEKDIAHSYTSPDGTYEDALKSRDQVRQVKNAIKDIPTTVIVAQKSIDDPEMNKFGLWLELQKEMASYSTKSKLIIAKNSGHNVPGDEPEVVANAILDMLSNINR